MSERLPSPEQDVKQRFDAYVEAHVPEVYETGSVNREASFAIDDNTSLIPVGRVIFQESNDCIKELEYVDVILRTYAIKIESSIDESIEFSFCRNEGEIIYFDAPDGDRKPADELLITQFLDKLNEIEISGGFRAEGQ